MSRRNGGNRELQRPLAKLSTHQYFLLPILVSLPHLVSYTLNTLLLKRRTLALIFQRRIPITVITVMKGSLIGFCYKLKYIFHYYGSL